LILYEVDPAQYMLNTMWEP